LPKTAACALAACAGLALSTPAAASPQDVFGYGPRSSAMAGAGTSIGQGFETVRSNPALLSLSHERSLSVGWFGAFFDLSANQRVPAEAVSGTLIGGALPLPFEGFLKDRLTLGLGFFTPFKLVARARLLYPEKPKFPFADRTQSVAVQMGLGLDIGHGLRLGGGFAALAGLTGAVLVATDASGRVGTVVEDTLVAGYGPILGASFERGPYRVGFTYRGELKAPFDVVIEVRDLGSIVVPPLHISGLAQYDPHQAELEVSRAIGPFHVALGATYRRWSDYPGAVEPTVRCPPTALGQEPLPCAPLIPAPPRYSDTVAPRIGAEGEFPIARGMTLKARAGYAFEPSPAPEQNERPNDFDNHRSVFALGYGLSLAAPLPRLDVDVFGQLHLLHDRDHHKPGGEVFKTHGTAVALGATLGVSL
jgi:long-subunit fatty acid transport protein